MTTSRPKLEPRISGEARVERRIKQIMADVLDLNPMSVDDSTCQDRVTSWDSLNHIQLVLALEQEFEVSFEVGEIEAMLSYPDIRQLLERKLHP
ncbi:MAG: acyl carrier protein [Gemmatimonadetes bacterium]|jgi:acyl carrier protein|nr:MAG: acyl carrier protein [Gemmatimonadota bacterium]PYP47622.1 MAG: acyl carrier protein [Gemmatimonadota bacterium]